MRRPAKDLDLALCMRTEGMSVASIARTLRAHPTAVRRWIERAGAHVKCVSDENLDVGDPREVQLDELRVGGIGLAEATWAWSAIEVKGPRSHAAATDADREREARGSMVQQTGGFDHAGSTASARRGDHRAS